MLLVKSHGLRMLCNSPEIPTEWKFESVSDRRTIKQGKVLEMLNAYASKNWESEDAVETCAREGSGTS